MSDITPDGSFPGVIPEQFPGGPEGESQSSSSGTTTPPSGANVAYTIFIGAVVAGKAVLNFRVGDNGIQIQEQLRYPDGTPIDLTGKTVTLELVTANGSTMVWAHAATVLYAVIGIAQYILTSADLAEAGAYYRRWIIQDSFGNQFTYPEDVNLAVTVQL